MSPAAPNRRRPRLYDAESIARNYRETFTDKPVSSETEFSWTWPAVLQHVGDSLAVAYESDKWKKAGDYVLYKHLAESRNRALCVPGFLRDFDEPSRRWKAIGPHVSFAEVPMPKHFAVLARFEELNLKLHTRGTDMSPRFGRGDDGVVKVTVRHGMLGGSKIRWSEKYDDMADQPLLVVYTASDGPLVVIVGEELEIEADGIVG